MPAMRNPVSLAILIPIVSALAGASALGAEKRPRSTDGTEVILKYELVVANEGPSGSPPRMV